jgi:hypothetical protein
MKIRIGTFDEIELEEIKDLFKDAGVRCEVKKNVEIFVDVDVYAEGRLSEVKERLSNTELKDVVEEWEKYIEMAKELLSGGEISINEFEETILNEAVPEQKELETLGSAVKKMADERGVKLDELEPKERIKVVGELMEEVLKRDDAVELVKNTELVSRKSFSVLTPLYDILDLNGIEYDDETIKGKLPDDPIVKIPVPSKIEPKLADELGLTVNFSVDLVDYYDVYVDVLEAYAKWDFLLNDERLAELTMVLTAIDGIIDVLSDKKKIELDELIAFTKTIKIDKNSKIVLETNTVKKLIKALEKRGIVKIKRNFVKFCD